VLTSPAEQIAYIDAVLERRERGETLRDEAHRLAGDFRAFQRAAWPFVIPAAYVETWHMASLAEHYQAAI